MIKCQHEKWTGAATKEALLQLDKSVPLGFGCSIVHKATDDIRPVQPSRFCQYHLPIVAAHEQGLVYAHLQTMDKHQQS